MIGYLDVGFLVGDSQSLALPAKYAILGPLLAPIEVQENKASGAVSLRKLAQAAENHAAQSRRQQTHCD